MQARRRRFRRAGPLAVALGLVVQLFVWGALPAASQAPGEPVDLRGFANGTALHLDGLNFGEDLRVANVDAAFAAAAGDGGAGGLSGLRHLNELSLPFHNRASDKVTYGMADSVEVGLFIDPPEDDPTIGLPGRVEADAPPSSSAFDEVVDLDLSPLLQSNTITGAAAANTQDTGLLHELCRVGDDLSRGRSFVSNLDVLEGVVEAETPGDDLNALETRSRTILIPGGEPGKFGLMSEVRQIYAPVIIAIPNLSEALEPIGFITIEVLGEWRLAAKATGVPGGASVEYGPVGADEHTPLVRITIDLLDPLFDGLFGAEEILVTTQSAPLVGEAFGELVGAINDIFGSIPDELLDVVIGETARALVGPGENPDPGSSPEVAGDGTRASGATDVVRARLLDVLPGGEVLDLRIGHMEAAVEVPAGGIECPIPVSKSANPLEIVVGGDPDTSTVEITVTNAFDCDLDNVVLIDRMFPTEGSPDFALTAANPSPASPSIPTGTLKEAEVRWELGRIASGESVTVSVDVTAVGPEGGLLEDIAEADAVLVDCAGEDVAGLDLDGLGIGGLSPRIEVALAGALAVLPVTGGAAVQTLAVGGALALLATGLGIAFRRRGGVH
jgi:hypothetical protein